MGTIFKAIGQGLTHPLSALDPAGTVLGSIAEQNPNSSLAKAFGSLPGSGSGFQKIMSPQQYAAGQAYDNRLSPPAGYVEAARSYAGVDPTLSAAAGGYKSAPSTLITASSINGPSQNAWASSAVPGQQSQAYITAARNAAANGWGQSGY